MGKVKNDPSRGFVIPSSVFSMLNTGKTAFVLNAPSSKLKNIISQHVAYLEGQTTSCSYRDLIGFYFVISEVSEDFQIKIQPVFFNGDEFSYSDKAEDVMSLTKDDIHYIFEIGYQAAGGESKKFVLSKNADFFGLLENNGLSELVGLEIIGSMADKTRLDFFDNSIELVYFSVDQLKPLVLYYEQIILTGCSLNLGKFVGERVEKDIPSEGPFFSLKVEAKNFIPPPDIDVNQLQNGQPNGEGDLMEGDPMFAVAPPCPPHWYQFGIMFQGLLEKTQDPSSLIIKRNDLKTSWKLTTKAVIEAATPDS